MLPRNMHTATVNMVQDKVLSRWMVDAGSRVGLINWTPDPHLKSDPSPSQPTDPRLKRAVLYPQLTDRLSLW